MSMNIPAERWFKAIPNRTSRRQYENRAVPPDILQSLKTTCDTFRPFPCSRAVLVPLMPENFFRGVVGSYGAVKGAVSCIIFVGDSTDPEYQTKTGYTGEGVVLEATALGLGTCWVAGFFRRDLAAKEVDLKDSEKVLAISPVGFPTPGLSREEKMLFGEVHTRRPLAELVEGIDEAGRPDWLVQVLEAARFAPSATNRQPWRFTVDTSGITVSEKGLVDLGVSRRLDCGIAMLHLEVAALNFGIKSSWEFLKTPGVARLSYQPAQ